MPGTLYDLLIIGGGINGAGIAADAAGRGLKVLLAEMNDLGGATSSASSKLIHGGLRYLEHYELSLVRQALKEREVLLQVAPHIVTPIRFVVPHMSGGRSQLLIRAGLFLYDHLARRRHIPGSAALDLASDPAGRPLRSELSRGFAYWDCAADDSRLVVLNARAAADHGAVILTRTRVAQARAEGGVWWVRLDRQSSSSVVAARVLVNAAGPWAGRLAGDLGLDRLGIDVPRLRLVKGSHIVVPRIAGAEDAYLIQCPDGRVVFAIPFEQRFTLIGTTEVVFPGDPARSEVTPQEENYLLECAGRIFREPIRASDIVWRFWGVRPLYDDATSNPSPSAVTRDYRLELASGPGHPPLLTVLGGKLTTYRRLAEAALQRLAFAFPAMSGLWTARAPLPGGNLGLGGLPQLVDKLMLEYPGFERDALLTLARRYGSRARDLLGEAKVPSDLGEDLGAGLTEREVEFLKHTEWAQTADDILWRRTKAGLQLGERRREETAKRIQMLL